MVTLKETERVEVLEFDNIFYTCLVDSNEGLITYEYMPYLSKKDGVITFNFEKFTEDTKYIVDYDISKKLRQVFDPYSYRDFIVGISLLQDSAYKINAIKEYMIKTQIFNKELIEQVKEISNLVETMVKGNEDIFKNKIMPAIPSNWCFAMFPESSWSAYDFMVAEQKFASGHVDVPASERGLTKSKIQGRYDRSRAEREMKVFEGLQAQIENEEKREHGEL